jgi:hypothetical protein
LALLNVLHVEVGKWLGLNKNIKHKRHYIIIKGILDKFIFRFEVLMAVKTEIFTYRAGKSVCFKAGCFTTCALVSLFMSVLEALLKLNICICHWEPKESHVETCMGNREAVSLVCRIKVLYRLR